MTLLDDLPTNIKARSKVLRQRLDQVESELYWPERFERYFQLRPKLPEAENEKRARNYQIAKLATQGLKDGEIATLLGMSLSRVNQIRHKTEATLYNEKAHRDELIDMAAWIERLLAK